MADRPLPVPCGGSQTTRPLETIMTTTVDQYDVIEIGTDNSNYDDPIADEGRLAVQHEDVFMAYAEDLDDAKRIIAAEVGHPVKLVRGSNYYSGRRWDAEREEG